MDGMCPPMKKTISLNEHLGRYDYSKTLDTMRFPFEITYKLKLVGDIEKFATSDILDFVRNDFKKSGADSVRVIKDTVFAENRLLEIRIRPGLNWNRWIGIGYAKLQIVELDNSRYAIYSFNLTRILFIGALMGIFIGFLTHIYWIGLITFGVLGLLNWLTKLIQHWASLAIVLENLKNESRKKLIPNNLER